MKRGDKFIAIKDDNALMFLKYDILTFDRPYSLNSLWAYFYDSKGLEQQAYIKEPKTEVVMIPKELENESPETIMLYLAL